MSGGAGSGSSMQGGSMPMGGYNQMGTQGQVSHMSHSGVKILPKNDNFRFVPRHGEAIGGGGGT